MAIETDRRSSLTPLNVPGAAPQGDFEYSEDEKRKRKKKLDADGFKSLEAMDDDALKRMSVFGQEV